MASTQPAYDEATHEWTLPTEFVDCDVDGEIRQLDVKTLVCVVGASETADEWCSWVEYRRPGEPKILHRSVRLHLKKAMAPVGIAQAVLA